MNFKNIGSVRILLAFCLPYGKDIMFVVSNAQCPIKIHINSVETGPCNVSINFDLYQEFGEIVLDNILKEIKSNAVVRENRRR